MKYLITFIRNDGSEGFEYIKSTSRYWAEICLKNKVKDIKEITDIIEEGAL